VPRGNSDVLAALHVSTIHTHYTAFCLSLGASSLHISLPNLSISLPFLAMSSATVTNNSESNAAHPLESFRPSMDYQHFESTVIRLSSSRSNFVILWTLITAPPCPLLPTPGRPSLDGLITLLIRDWLITKTLPQSLFHLFLDLMYLPLE